MLVIIYYLPMRNWNISKPSKTTTSPSHLLLTYEELKHERDWSSKTHSNFIYYLPMRNWNIIINTSPFQGRSFTTYLWGIETLLNQICQHLYKMDLLLTYEELKHFPLPNSKTSPSLFTTYLWGIETKHLLMVV